MKEFIEDFLVSEEPKEEDLNTLSTFLSLSKESKIYFHNKKGLDKLV